VPGPLALARGLRRILAPLRFALSTSGGGQVTGPAIGLAPPVPASLRLVGIQGPHAEGVAPLAFLQLPGRVRFQVRIAFHCSTPCSEGLVSLLAPAAVPCGRWAEGFRQPVSLVLPVPVAVVPRG